MKFQSSIISNYNNVTFFQEQIKKESAPNKGDKWSNYIM